MLALLILIRHGTYYDYSLSEVGRYQMQRLAGKLAPLFEGKRHRIFSTEIRYAKQSAEVFCESLGLEFESDRGLEPDSELLGEKRSEEILKFIENHQQDTEVLAAITHGPVTRCFPAYYGKKVLGVDWDFIHGVEKGQAVVIDCLTKSFSVIS